jgi:prepilin-type N-terminal cleavage/methylation domain-containing protein
MNGRLRERGFTLVELLVVVVIGTVLVLSAYQLLVTNTRGYAIMREKIQGQGSLRASNDILSGELREISILGGDLIHMEDTTLTIRAQRTFGVVCEVDYLSGVPKVNAYQFGPVFEQKDSVFILHDNNPSRASDDRWFGGLVGNVDATTDCNGKPAQTMTLSFLSKTAKAIPPDSVRVGAPIRGFDVFTYGLMTYEGESYLGRQARGSYEVVPLIGPLLPGRGVSFRYLDNLGQVTSVNAEVAQIEVSLVYESELRNFRNEVVSDSLVVRVYPRN